MSRGQWISYADFNLVNLIEELKTRFDNEMEVDSTLHGIIIVGKDYYGICKEIRDFLHNDDEKWLKDNKNIADKLLEKVNHLELKCIDDRYLIKGKIYNVIAWDGGWKYGDLLIIDDNYEIKWYRREFFNCEEVDLRDVLYFKDHYKFNIKNYIESEVK